jgi:hypothetical protein
MLFEDTFATSANRAAAVTGGTDGVELLDPPQPIRRMGTIRIRSEHAIFLKDIRVLAVEIKPQSRTQLEIEATPGWNLDSTGAR